MEINNNSNIKVSNNKPLGILGNPNTGKTNLMVYLAKSSRFKKIYILGYPKKIEGFIALSSMQDLTKISDCCLCIDEIDEFVPFYERKSNEALKRLLKFTAHNNIKLIFTTQLSQFISKMMEALVPQWAITEIDIFSLKNGSKPKRILLDLIKLPHIMNKQIGMKLPIGKYIWYNNDAIAGENGIKKFPFMNIDKAWGTKIPNKSANKIPNKSANKSCIKKK